MERHNSFSRHFQKLRGELRPSPTGEGGSNCTHRPDGIQTTISLPIPGPAELPNGRQAKQTRSMEAPSAGVAEPFAPLTSLPADVHVKEDPRVLGVRGLRCWGRMRHLHLQTLENETRGPRARDGLTRYSALRDKLATRGRATSCAPPEAALELPVTSPFQFLRVATMFCHFLVLD